MRAGVVAKPRGAADQLDDVVDDFDALVSGARAMRSPREFDRLEEQAQSICARILAAFRGKAST